MDQGTHNHPELERHAALAQPEAMAASREPQPQQSASLARAAESAKRFSAEHPWVVVGAATCLGAALGAGSRRVPQIDRDHLAQAGSIASSGLRMVATRAAMNFVMRSLFNS